MLARVGKAHVPVARRGKEKNHSGKPSKFKFNTCLPYDPAIPLTEISSRGKINNKAYIHIKMHTELLRAALFITAKTRRQPKYSASRD